MLLETSASCYSSKRGRIRRGRSPTGEQYNDADRRSCGLSVVAGWIVVGRCAAERGVHRRVGLAVSLGFVSASLSACL